MNNKSTSKMKRRDFMLAMGAASSAFAIAPFSTLKAQTAKKKMRVALVGTGVRGAGMWGRGLVEHYSDYVEFVGLCDINPGRLETVKQYMGVTCPTFTDFEEMMKKTTPETLIVTTVDSTHHEFIIKGMEMGADIITEKPMTTDEFKCQKIHNTSFEIRASDLLIDKW